MKVVNIGMILMLSCGGFAVCTPNNDNEINIEESELNNCSNSELILGGQLLFLESKYNVSKDKIKIITNQVGLNRTHKLLLNSAYVALSTSFFILGSMAGMYLVNLSSICTSV